MAEGAEVVDGSAWWPEQRRGGGPGSDGGAAGRGKGEQRGTHLVRGGAGRESHHGRLENGDALHAYENADAVSYFKEQILQLAGLACHEDEEKSRTELLEKLGKCNKYTLVELCRSFDIPGSTGTKKDELVTIVMEFLMEHCSGIDGTGPDKKVKKRKRKKEGVNLSGGKPLKKNKPDGTLLETCGEEEADGRKGKEERINSPEFDSKDNMNECVDHKKRQFPKEEANPEPSGRVNGSMSQNLAVVSLSEVPVPANEQILAMTPSEKLVSNCEDGNTDMKASSKKNTSVIKKKSTAQTDGKDKSCGKKMSSGDLKPRKQTVKPSRDELKQAVFFILDTANFATMTFGEVVKAVDKYFGKDLFERKPLIRSLIEEELFRLAEEAEKKELEEEEAIKAKARAEQAAMEIAKDGRVESDTYNANELQTGQDGKCKDAAKNENCNSVKGVIGGISVNSAENTNSDPAAESSHGGKSEVDTKNDNSIDEYTKDGIAKKFVQNANGDDVVEITRSVEAKTVRQNNNCNTIGCSEDGKTEETKNGENDDTEECRSGNDHKKAKNVSESEAEESNINENVEHVKCAEDCKAQEAGGNENVENTVFHGSKCCKPKEAIEDVNSEQHLTDTTVDDRAEDSEGNLEHQSLLKSAELTATTDDDDRVVNEGIISSYKGPAYGMTTDVVM